MGRQKAFEHPVIADSVLIVLDAFLEWCQKNKAKRTYDWYRNYLESFARTLPAGTVTTALKPLHVQRWLDANPGWDTGKRGAVIAVQRAFNWAVRMGTITNNPVRGIEKPAAGRRDQVISVEQFAAMIALIRDREFRDLLTVCWESRCRPQEVLAVEARHVDLPGACWTFPILEAKGRKQHRVVYLADTALSITRRLMETRTRVQLFVNTDGRSWSSSSLNCRFRRLRVALGR